MAEQGPSARYSRKNSAVVSRLWKGKRVWGLIVFLTVLLVAYVVQECTLSKASLRRVLATSQAVSQSLDASKGKLKSEQKSNMRSAWGIAVATDEVLKLSSQLVFGTSSSTEAQAGNSVTAHGK